MNIREENRTRKWIIDALFDLIGRRDYHDITIARIVDKAGLGRRTFYRYFKTKDEVVEYTAGLLMGEFAELVLAEHADTLETIMKSYFEFWENYMDVLILLKKAHLLYFIEDNMLPLVCGVAQKAGHIPADLSEEKLLEKYEQYKFEFAFKLSGIWKVTLLWCEEYPRKTPEEMGRLIDDMLK